MRGQKATKPCVNCGKLLTRLVSQARGKNWYCDNACQAAHAPSPITVAGTPNPLRGQRETRPCANCGKPVVRYLSQMTAGRAWTCSRHCGGVIRSARLAAEGRLVLPTKPRRGATAPCPICGKPVYRNAGQAAKRQGVYCSPTCRNTAQTKEAVVKSCPRCGAEMRLKPSQAHIAHCSRACQTLDRIKRPLDREHNGRPAKQDQRGYVMVWEPEHPNKTMRGWQYQHRLVAEQRIGRLLRSDEHVHHVNGIKDDNSSDNLVVMSANEHAALSSAEHQAAITKERAELAEYRRLYGVLEREI